MLLLILISILGSTRFLPFAEEFLVGCTHLVKGFAEICTISVAVEATFTEWNDYQQHRNLKKSQDPTHA